MPSMKNERKGRGNCQRNGQRGQGQNCRTNENLFGERKRGLGRCKANGRGKGIGRGSAE